MQLDIGKAMLRNNDNTSAMFVERFMIGGGGGGYSKIAAFEGGLITGSLQDPTGILINSNDPTRIISCKDPGRIFGKILPGSLFNRILEGPFQDVTRVLEGSCPCSIPGGSCKDSHQGKID